jgi:hypothetical protein
MVNRIFVRLNKAFSFALNERENWNSVDEKPKPAWSMKQARAGLLVRFAQF